MKGDCYGNLRESVPVNNEVLLRDIGSRQYPRIFTKRLYCSMGTIQCRCCVECDNGMGNKWDRDSSEVIGLEVDEYDYIYHPVLEKRNS